MKTPIDPYSMAERRKFVALPANQSKSNRALAKELRLDEGTIRRDRKYLRTPVDKRPAPKVRLPNPPKPPKLYDPSNAEKHRKRMLAAAKQWLEEQALILPDVEWVVDQAGRELYFGWQSIANLPPPIKSPADLFPLVRPKEEVEDYMPPKLYFCKDWLARWLACCLPRQAQAQERMLLEILRMAQLKVAPWLNFPPI